MKKKDRIKELERRVALLEAEIAGLRGQRVITWPTPNMPNPWTSPTITCTAREVDGKALTDMLRREIKTHGLAGIN
jgi:hypothetical protein